MTLEEDLVVRPLRNDDIPAVVQLLQDVFEPWPRVPTSASSIDHLHWKLGDGRPGHQSHFVAELHGRVIAFQLNLHWPMKAGERTLDAQRGWDAGVHPDYQGQGVMSIMRPRMIERFDVKPDIFLGASSHPALIQLYDKEDRRTFAHRWLIFVRPLSMPAALRAFKIRPDHSTRKLPARFGMLMRWIDTEMRTRFVLRPETDLIIQTIPKFDERIDEFCAQALTQFDFASVRTKELLNWRYADPRAGQFTIRLATDPTGVIGYSVLRVANGRGHIADLLAQPGRPAVANALLRDAVSELGARTSSIECWAFDNSPFVPALESVGFLGQRHPRQLTYEAVGVPVEEIEFVSGPSIKVHLSVGDMDWV